MRKLRGFAWMVRHFRRLLALAAVLMSLAVWSGAPAEAQSPVSENIERLLNSDLSNTPPGSPGFQMLMNDALTGGPGAINPNAGAGMVINSDGGTINLISSNNNSFTGNSGDGLVLTSNNGGTLTVNNLANSTFSNNGGSGISGAVQGQGSTLSFNVTGSTISNNGGAGVIAGANDGSLSMNVGMSGAGNGNIIEGNVGAGVGVGLLRFSEGNIGIQNNLITGTLAGTGNFDGSGIVLDRRQASLLTGDVDPITGRAAAQVGDNQILGNEGSGVSLLVSGSDPSQMGQPNQGTANGVMLQNNTISGNELDGVSGRLFADSALVLDGRTNSITDNLGNGVSLTTSGDSTLGNPLDADISTARSIFDGTIVTGNGMNGVQITMNDNSQALMEFRSGAGDSIFAGNGFSGFDINAPMGTATDFNFATSDILIQGDTDGSLNSGNFSTIIAGNGTNLAGLGGNGITITASDFAAPTLTVQSTTIFGNLGDGAGNNGDGIQMNAIGTAAAPTLNVGGFNSTADPITPGTLGRLNDGLTVNRGVFIDGNQGDGIEVNLRGGGANVATLNVQESVIGASQNSGNGGNGILIIGEGTADPNQFASAQIITNVSGTRIFGNAGNGVDIQLSGAIGTRNGGENQFNFVESNNPLLGQVGNVISTNGRNGIMYVSDPGDLILERNDDGMGNLVPTSFREVRIPNAPGDDNPNPGGMPPILVNPNNPPFNTLPDYQQPFLNTDTQLNSVLNIEGSVIEFNGTNLVEGEGIFTNIGTGSRLSMNVDNNLFRGNNRSDLRTQSFVSGSDPPGFINDASPNPDRLYLDNTAILDITFSNNQGNRLDVSRVGLDPAGMPNRQQARYTNPDIGKNPSVTPGGINDPIERRLAAIFRVNLGAGGNNFSVQGQTVDVPAEFANGIYSVNQGPNPPVPDPAFP